MAWRKRITPAKIFTARLKRRGEFWFWSRTTFLRGPRFLAPTSDWGWFRKPKKRETKRESWDGSSSFENRSLKRSRDDTVQENKKEPSDKLGPFLFLEATIYSAQQTD